MMTAIVPAGATTGPIQVTTPSGTASSSSDFVVTTFVVTTTADSGPGSLREAILNSNANPSGYTNSIPFAISSGPQTITPLSELPMVTYPAVIDGTTQPGFAGTPIIELNGTSAGAVPGLIIRASDCAVRGLVINRFSGAGIQLGGFGGGNSSVEGNYIGTDITGTAALGNAVGIRVLDAGSRIVGNLISGNSEVGVRVGETLSFFASGTIVQGNRVGTDAFGASALPNADGITINWFANATQILDNLISGNSGSGLSIFRCFDVVIHGNYVGTDSTGTSALPNSAGIFLVQASRTIIGGATPGSGNLISGNNGHGIAVYGVPDPGGHANSANVIQGNIIGTDTSRATALPNQGDGVLIAGSAATNNPVFGNTIFGNTGLGINLLPLVDFSGNPLEPTSTVTPNDVGDPDTGPNQLQNFPVITGAATSGTGTVITGTLNSTSNTAFIVDVYASVSADSSGNGEGQFYLGSTTVTTDPNGDASFSFGTPGKLSGQVATATARNASTGDTSEFSSAFPVP